MSLDTEEEKTTTTKLACLPSSQQQKKDLFNQSHVLGQFPSPTLRIRTSSWDSIRRSRPLPGRWKSSKRKCNIENHLDRVQNKFLPYQAFFYQDFSSRRNLRDYSSGSAELMETLSENQIFHFSWQQQFWILPTSA